MKRFIICTLFSIFAFQGFAQNKRDTVLVITTDTARADKKKNITISIGKSGQDSVKKEIKPSSKFSLSFVLSRIDIGLSTYTDKGSFTLTPANSYLERETWKSSNFGFEFFQMGYRFNSYIKIYAGAGLDWNHMRLKQNITLLPDQNEITPVTEAIDFKKNRFSSQYLRIPLSFQFRTADDKKGNKVYFVFGPEVGFLLNGKQKQVSKEEGKNKFKDDFNLNPFRYGGFARLGYDDLGVFVKYYGNDVFAKDQGPADFKNLNFGLTLGF